MRYKSFTIKNFKGIKDTTISLEGAGGAGVFAFVGLNESGKTTVLEAIHSFSPDDATSELLGGDEGIGVPYKARVPRHMISTFTGSVSVSATLSVTNEDKATIERLLLNNHEIIVDRNTIADEVTFERRQDFKDGDFKTSFFSLLNMPAIKRKKQRKWSQPSGDDYKVVRDAVYSQTPDIAYFPTFVFDFPERFYLTARGNSVDRFYRRVFQDILDYDGQGHTIAKDIVRRVRSEEMVKPWVTFIELFNGHDDRQKIQHVMDRAGAAVTRLVFGRWNKIFGEDTKGKEIIVSYDPVEGQQKDARGTVTKTETHDVRVQFKVRDGTRRFNVNDRSLGFRWFFAFMLFTQFRVARSASRPLLFLFDEPASNLHAAAQQKLIDCFPEIAQKEHMLAYSTHSHYMIEPKWLEQTFIVTNRADAPVDSILDNASLDDESLDVKVTSYRNFVNEHPVQTSYFQPILDRLEVVPSRFDIQRSSVILEGRSDYYILRYAARLLKKAELPLLPALGAGTFGALAAIHVGWNLRFLFVLDADHQGIVERERYVKEFGIPGEAIVTLSDFVPGTTVIEDLLDDNAYSIIGQALGTKSKPSKPQVRRFFQEMLASDQVEELGTKFRANAKAIIEAIEKRLKAAAKA